jgi:hypothetical protein
MPFELEELETPPVLPGTLGAKDSWMTFPWAQGSLGSLKPTVGPFKVQITNDNRAIIGANLFILYGWKGTLGHPKIPAFLRSLNRLAEIGMTPPTGKSQWIQHLVEPYGRAWSQKFTFDNAKGGLHITSGKGAAIKFSRSKGGRGKFISGLLHNNLWKGWYFQDLELPLYNVFGEVVIGEWTEIFISSDDDGLSRVPLGLYCAPHDEDVQLNLKWDRIDQTHRLKNTHQMKTPNLNSVAELLCWASFWDREHAYDEKPFIGQFPEGGVPLHGSENPFLKLYRVRPNFELKLNPEYVPELVADAVPGTGMKARPLTKSHPDEGTLHHLVRTYVQNKMMDDPQCSALSRGSGDTVKNQFRGTLADFIGFMNLDLTSATDWFLHAICQGLMRGICSYAVEELGPAGKKVQLLATLLATPSLITFAKRWIKLGASPLPFLTSRGQYMGLAESWCCLNVYLRLFWDIALAVSEKGVDLTRLTTEGVEGVLRSLTPDDISLSKLNTARCGDDQFSHCSSLKRRNFLFLLTEIGEAKISKGTNSYGHHGQFCKSLYQRVYNDWKSEYEIRYIDIVRPRAFCHMLPTTRLPGTQKNVSKLYTRGGTASREIRWFRWRNDKYGDSMVKRLTRLVTYNNYDLICKAREMQLPVWTPSNLGGMEFPTLDEYPLRKESTQVVAFIRWIHRDDQNALNYLHRFENVMIWKPKIKGFSKGCEDWLRPAVERWITEMISAEHQIVQPADWESESKWWFRADSFVEIINGDAVEINKLPPYTLLQWKTERELITLKDVIDVWIASDQAERAFTEVQIEETSLPSLSIVKRRFSSIVQLIPQYYFSTEGISFWRNLSLKELTGRNRFVLNSILVRKALLHRLPL